MDLSRVLDYSLKRLYAAYDFFLQNGSRVRNPTVAALLRDLALEQESLIKYVKALGRAVSQNASLPKYRADMDVFDRERVLAEALDDENVALMEPDVAIIRMAYLMQKDTAEYLQRAGNRMEQPLQLAIENVAGQARQQAVLFQKLHGNTYEALVEEPWEGD